jgi:hypothetical protein
MRGCSRVQSKGTRNRRDTMGKWISGTTCDLCNEDATKKGEFFFDAVVRGPRGGVWALICERCVIGNVYGLGEGQGQQYRSDTKERVAPTFNVKSYMILCDPIDDLL